MTKLNIISPIYNEEKNLGSFIEKLFQVEKKILDGFNLETNLILIM